MHEYTYVSGVDASSSFSWKDRDDVELLSPSAKCFNCRGSFTISPGTTLNWPKSNVFPGWGYNEYLNQAGETIKAVEISEDALPENAVIGYWHSPLEKACIGAPSGFCAGRLVMNEFTGQPPMW